MPTITEKQDLDQAALLLLLAAARPHQAIGAALALLLEVAETNPGQLQAVLRTQVDRIADGRVEKRLIIDVLASVARGMRA